MYSAFNVITAPKKLTLLLENGHPATPEQTDATERWVLDFLKLK
jgi:hypothetical protein